MDISIDITNTTIETDRLVLRAWKEADVNDLFEYASIDGLGEMAGWKHHESIEESRHILKSFMAQKDVFAIEYRDNGRVIGSLGLHSSWANDDPNFSNLKSKEIGYALSKNYWGKGIMPEAVKAVIDFGFTKLDLDALTCGHFLTNIQSKRVIEKCNFKYIKTSEFYSQQMNKTFTDMKYILLKH